jgi:hypothetical protein
VVFAADADIRDLGIATPNWYQTSEAAHSLSVTAGGAWGGLLSIRLGGYSLAATGRGLMKVARHPMGQMVLGAAVIALFMTRSWWRPQVRARLAKVGPRLDSVMERAAPIIERIRVDYRAANATWDAAMFDGSDASLLQSAARILAASPHPLSRTEIARRLHSDASDRVIRATVAELGSVLSGYQAFVEVNAHDWQLGRTNMNFGREPPEMSLLRCHPTTVAPR